VRAGIVDEVIGIGIIGAAGVSIYYLSQPSKLGEAAGGIVKGVGEGVAEAAGDVSNSLVKTASTVGNNATQSILDTGGNLVTGVLKQAKKIQEESQKLFRPPIPKNFLPANVSGFWIHQNTTESTLPAAYINTWNAKGVKERTDLLRILGDDRWMFLDVLKVDAFEQNPPVTGFSKTLPSTETRYQSYYLSWWNNLSTERREHYLSLCPRVKEFLLTTKADYLRSRSIHTP
jgi:hypothetical protein